MSFRKFQADGLFTGVEMLPSDKVLICNEQGVVTEIIHEAEAGGNIQKLNGILTPGFINCHCHLELSHMKGLLPEGTGLVDFVFSIVTQRHFPEEEILQSISDAENEMLQNGIVAVGDICNNLLTLPQKLKKKLQYYNFIEASGWMPAVAETRFQRSKNYYEEFSKEIASSIVPHAPYSVSDELWAFIKPYFHHKVTSIHNQETVFEDELFIQNSGDFVRMYKMMKMDTSFFAPSGKSSLQTYFGQLSGAARVLLVHNTFTKEADIQFIKKSRPEHTVSMCLCVNANQYIEQSLPPVDLFRQHDCHIVLGTDSLASNHNLSIWEEVKTIQKNFPHVPLEEVLKWATINGAEAMQMDNTLGSFEKGKQPGVILLPAAVSTETKAVKPQKLL